MLRTVRIYGNLAKFLKRRSFKADVATAAEAVKFLLANFPQLERHMAEHHYEVKVGDHPLMLGEDPGELHLPTGQRETISIIPVVAGAGATGRIIAGVALIALSLLFAPGAALAGGLFTLGPMAVSVGVGIGASLALGGVAQLLTPTPQLQSQTKGQNSDADPRKSYSFSGIQNVSRQGLPVPIVYGETIVGSIVISAGVSTEQVAS
jgi:predicted phage tail protein